MKDEQMLIDEEKYIADWFAYCSKFTKEGKGAFELDKKNMFPCLTDYRAQAGTMDAHYFPMDILVASLIIGNGNKEHMDVGSRIDGFVSHLLAAGIDVTEMDIRPLVNYEPGYGLGRLKFVQGDATRLSELEDNSVNSLSSLHAIEHFGLGRYGDSVEPNACFDAMKALQRVLRKEGMLYMAVPISNNERVCFNAHRIFNPLTVIEEMDLLKLRSLYYIQDMKIKQIDVKNVESSLSLLGEYDCGIFVFEK